MREMRIRRSRKNSRSQVGLHYRRAGEYYVFPPSKDSIPITAANDIANDVTTGSNDLETTSNDLENASKTKSVTQIVAIWVNKPKNKL